MCVSNKQTKKKIVDSSHSLEQCHFYLTRVSMSVFRLSMFRLPETCSIKDFIIFVCSQVARRLHVSLLSPLSRTSPAICNSSDDLTEFDKSSKEKNQLNKCFNEFVENMPCWVRRKKPERNSVWKRQSRAHMLLSTRESTRHWMFTNVLAMGKKFQPQPSVNHKTETPRKLSFLGPSADATAF